MGQKVHVSCSLLFQSKRPKSPAAYHVRPTCSSTGKVFSIALAFSSRTWRRRLHRSSEKNRIFNHGNLKGPLGGDHSRTGGCVVKMVAPRWIPTLSPIRWKIFPNDSGHDFLLGDDFLIPFWGPAASFQVLLLMEDIRANQSRSSLSHSLQGFLTSHVVQDFFRNKEGEKILQMEGNS